MRKPIVDGDVCDFLKNITVEKVFMQIWNKMRDLVKMPNLSDSRKIGEYNGLSVFRSSVGEYRIVYQYDNNYVYFMLVGKRNDDDIYKRYDRKMK